MIHTFLILIKILFPSSKVDLLKSKKYREKLKFNRLLQVIKKLKKLQNPIF